jgi:outer membrane lipoprotein carrier protein
MNLLSLMMSGFAALAAPMSGVAKAPPKVIAQVKPGTLAVADVIAKLQAFYATTTSIRGEFRQVFTSTLYADSTPSDGRFWIKKPGKMYWQYDKPDKKYFISNGKDFWLYEPKNTQAFHQPLSGQSLPDAVSFLNGKGTLERDFTITDARKDKADKTATKYAEAGDYALKLWPKKPQAAYKYLYLIVDPTDFHVKQTIIVESGGDTNQIKFINVETNPKTFITDSKFNFTPPKGVRVIEQSASPAPATTMSPAPKPSAPAVVPGAPAGGATAPKPSVTASPSPSVKPSTPAKPSAAPAVPAPKPTK